MYEGTCFRLFCPHEVRFMSKFREDNAMQCDDMTVVSSVSLTSGHDGAALGAGRAGQGGQGDRHQPRHRCHHRPHDLRGQCRLVGGARSRVRAVFMCRRHSCCLLPP